MATEETRALIHRYIDEIWTAWNLDRVDELMAQGFT